MKVREAGRIVPVAVTIAVGVNADRQREVRGLAGVKLVASDADEGLKAAVTKVLRATWQRCRMYFARNALAHADKAEHRIVSAWIGAVHAQWRIVADQLRPKVPKRPS